MALRKKYNIEVYGKNVEFDNAYIEIKSLNGTKDNMTMTIQVYDSDQKANVIDTKYYSYTPDESDTSVNNFKQGYNFLKTLDEYKDANDC
ncbi:hypothetical protein [Clostridium beijerinckii]|uniref:hypothetical protein n=1 Tax=Clostridium beijerinckii TaxID=1520 RepID=UPI00156D8A2A|nr:hypothetical protein [Clostridium beijerinckii]NRT69994.1 hypothetical protein [Clostridium beijerinckii]NRT70045.1 hypothetical protein [Clostridium beijerinckii]